MIPPSDSDDIGRVLRRVISAGLFSEEHPSIVVYDCTVLRDRANRVKRSFPDGTLNTVALKACPLPGVLQELKQLGMGAEAASLPEMEIALRSGFSPEQIVYDSPVKRHSEIGEALRRGVRLNADSLDEIARIDRLLGDGRPARPIGLRVNPQVGEGTIPQTGTAGRVSKFGVPLDEAGDAVRAAFRRHPWLTGLHVHIGSQGCSLELLVAGARRVADLAADIRSELARQGGGGRPLFIDVGGGLPVAYRRNELQPGVEEYRAKLDEMCPQLFSFDIITEFGRFVCAHAGWAATRVEYVKRSGPETMVMVHLGADMFVRRAYRPDLWHHDISLFTSQGEQKEGNSEAVTVAGPLCFSGDLLARDIRLPRPEEGDILVIHDAGAYTLGMWSRYNSRPMPRVVAYRGTDSGVAILKEREGAEDLWRFWR